MSTNSLVSGSGRFSETMTSAFKRPTWEVVAAKTISTEDLRCGRCPTYAAFARFVRSTLGKVQVAAAGAIMTPTTMYAKPDKIILSTFEFVMVGTPCEVEDLHHPLQSTFFNISASNLHRCSLSAPKYLASRRRTKEPYTSLCLFRSQEERIVFEGGVFQEILNLASAAFAF